MKINVDPFQLEHSASYIEEQVIQYETLYQQMLQQVETMRFAWQGKDNQVFTAQINGFEQDFRKMAILMRDYAQFLKTSAHAYRETQNERTELARYLAGR